jgi:SDR family mycofactocin-dependent oxidoreductase
LAELFTGRVAFVTGAARGQGRAHCVRLANEGADIIAVDIAGPLPAGVPYPAATPADFAKTVDLVQATGRRIVRHVVDVRDFEGLKSAVDDGVAELGRLDIIIVNAGISIPQKWHEVTPETFGDTLAINVTGAWNTVMAGAHHIIAGGRGGSIIVISSVAGVKMQPYMVPYTTSKHALTGLTRAFAAELGPHNIRVNSIHPGPVNTHMGSGDMIPALNKASQEVPALMQMGTPFLPNWVVKAEEVAAAACWLASDESRHITAVHLSVDNGMAQF